MILRLQQWRRQSPSAAGVFLVAAISWSAVAISRSAVFQDDETEVMGNT
ncbi:unnamed protein product [Arabidopsis halleri]